MKNAVMYGLATFAASHELAFLHRKDDSWIPNSGAPDNNRDERAETPSPARRLTRWFSCSSNANHNPQSEIATENTAMAPALMEPLLASEPVEEEIERQHWHRKASLLCNPRAFQDALIEQFETHSTNLLLKDTLETMSKWVPNPEKAIEALSKLKLQRASEIEAAAISNNEAVTISNIEALPEWQDAKEGLLEMRTAWENDREKAQAKLTPEGLEKERRRWKWETRECERKRRETYIQQAKARLQNTSCFQRDLENEGAGAKEMYDSIVKSSIAKGERYYEEEWKNERSKLEKRKEELESRFSAFLQWTRFENFARKNSEWRLQQYCATNPFFGNKKEEMEKDLEKNLKNTEEEMEKIHNQLRVPPVKGVEAVAEVVKSEEENKPEDQIEKPKEEDTDQVKPTELLVEEVTPIVEEETSEETKTDEVEEVAPIVEEETSEETKTDENRSEHSDN